MWGISEKGNYTIIFVWKSEGCTLSKNKGIILELTLEISAVVCRLDSSGSIQRHSDGITIPARAMLSVRDPEIATQIVLQNFKSAAAHYYRQYYTGPSEHFAVALWPSGGHKAETDQRCDDDNDRKFYAKFPLLKRHAHCICTACSVTVCSAVQLGMS